MTFIFFWQKEIGAKAVHKMLAKLTLGGGEVEMAAKQIIIILAKEEEAEHLHS